MPRSLADSPAAWKAADLRADPRWVFTLDEAARRDLLRAVRRLDAERHLLALSRADIDLGGAGPVLAAALRRRAKAG